VVTTRDVLALVGDDRGLFVLVEHGQQALAGHHLAPMTPRRWGRYGVDRVVVQHDDAIAEIGQLRHDAPAAEPAHDAPDQSPPYHDQDRRRDPAGRQPAGVGVTVGCCHRHPRQRGDGTDHQQRQCCGSGHGDHGEAGREEREGDTRVEPVRQRAQRARHRWQGDSSESSNGR
jgi:hypothetical protein